MPISFGDFRASRLTLEMEALAPTPGSLGLVHVMFLLVILLFLLALKGQPDSEGWMTMIGGKWMVQHQVFK